MHVVMVHLGRGGFPFIDPAKVVDIAFPPISAENAVMDGARSFLCRAEAIKKAGKENRRKR